MDYLQIMSREIEGEDSIDSVNALKLSQIAKWKNCPVLILSQIGDAPDQREQHRPTIADLFEKGLERCVDNIIFLYRDDYYNQRTDRKNISEIIIARNKHGDSGTVLLGWLSEHNKFYSLGV